MLRLQKMTREDWAAQAVHAIDEILLDHAHCEKKAASMALNLMFRYPLSKSFVPYNALQAWLSELNFPFKIPSYSLCNF